MSRTYHRRRRTRRALALVALAVLAATYGLRRWRPSRIEIEGGSMRPTLEPGDWALAVAPRGVRRGDVVVVEHPERPGFEMVKRVAAAPGERAPDGRVLSEAEIWVEGDAPDASTDSRTLGPVPFGGVTGLVVLVWWPPARARVLRTARRAGLSDLPSAG